MVASSDVSSSYLVDVQNGAAAVYSGDKREGQGHVGGCWSVSSRATMSSNLNSN